LENQEAGSAVSRAEDDTADVASSSNRSAEAQENIKDAHMYQAYEESRAPPCQQEHNCAKQTTFHVPLSQNQDVYDPSLRAFSDRKGEMR
jgi:hypothetical protein